MTNRIVTATEIEVRKVLYEQAMFAIGIVEQVAATRLGKLDKQDARILATILAGATCELLAEGLTYGDPPERCRAHIEDRLGEIMDTFEAARAKSKLEGNGENGTQGAQEDDQEPTIH